MMHNHECMIQNGVVFRLFEEATSNALFTIMFTKRHFFKDAMEVKHVMGEKN